MKFPPSVMILGREFSITVLPEVIHDGANVGGTCDFNNRRIEIAYTDYPDEAFSIFVHECVHAFLEITGINQRLTDAEEEMYCQLISAFVIDMVKAFQPKE